jgi:DNA-binding FrmR family transcriptional regulator
MMAEEAVSSEALLKRLKRIAGQVRGIQQMIENGPDCESIVTQLVAVRSAIEGVGALLLRNYMKLCFGKETVTRTDMWLNFDIRECARSCGLRYLG